MRGFPKGEYVRTLGLTILMTAFALNPAACSGEKAPRWSRAAIVDLVEVAEQAPDQGLPAETFAASELRVLFQESKRDANARDRLQVAADALYERLALRFGQGATDPAVADPQWRIPRADVLEEERTWRPGGAHARPSETLLSLLPSSREYETLQQEYVRVMGEPSGAADADGRTREQRITSLRASLERWRWLPRSRGAVRVEARLPQFEVLLVRADETPSVFNAIVGRERTQTPSFAGEIDGIILNPTWTAPRSIVVNELLPDMRRSVAARAQYDVLDARGRVVEPAQVDWNASPFPYQLRQRSGPANALGRIKFDMPNPYDVYLHDTPSRTLFAQTERALSHGCIRVERPIELAAALLGTSAEALEQEIATGVTQTQRLPSPVPFYALYFTATAWDGVVHYANDIYRRDAAIVAAIDAPRSDEVAARLVEAATPRCPAA